MFDAPVPFSVSGSPRADRMLSVPPLWTTVLAVADVSPSALGSATISRPAATTIWPVKEVGWFRVSELVPPLVNVGDPDVAVKAPAVVAIDVLSVAAPFRVRVPRVAVA